MKNYLAIFIAVFAILFVANPASAEIEEYKFDKVHTQILFFVDHLGFSKSQGEFHEYEGGFTFNRGEPEKSSVNISIDTSSIDMDNEKWNKHMRSADFFNVEKFPSMTFKSTSIDITGENTANIVGDLTILGVTKPVTLAVRHNKSGKHAFTGKYVSGFSATTSFKRSEFGMKYGLPLVGDEVQVRLEVEGIRQGDSDEFND